MPIFDFLKPIVSRARPTFGLPNTFWQVANRSWEISPAAQAIAAPAIFEECDLSKITGVFPGETIQSQVSKAWGGLGSHKATKAYELVDAIMAGGNLYSLKVALPLQSNKSFVRHINEVPRYRDAALASSEYGIKFFGHWMLDDLPRTLAAGEIAQPISVLKNPTASQSDFMQILNLTPKIALDASFGRMVIIDDVGQNPYKRARYERLRDLANTSIVHTTSKDFKSTTGVMMLRGSSGARRVLVNEEEVAILAKDRGMQVIDPSRQTAREMIAACSGAPIVLGVEGSHLSNALLWMHPQGKVVVIQPPQRFVMVLKDTCDCIGLGYAFVVADPVNHTDFKVDVGALSRLLDRLQ